MQEPLQGLDVVPFEAECQGQELVDRVGGVGAEAGEQLAAPAAGPQKLREELVRRGEIGLAQKPRQIPVRRLKTRIFVAPALQGLPKAAAAPVGELKQGVVVESDEGSLEDDGEGEVVVRQEQETTQRQEVHDRHLLDQNHAIAARHRDAALLQAAHHFLGEARAGAHQNHDVAGAHGAARRFQNLAPFQPSVDEIGDARRQARRRAHRRHLVEGCVPGIGVRRFLGGHRGPQLDQPGMVFTE